MKQTYCYHFNADSERGRKMRSFWRESNKAEAAAQKYCSRMGAQEYLTNPNFFAGGVAYVWFDEDHKPDARIWRKAAVIDGDDMYEPNVQITIGCMNVKHGFQPSNTWNTIYRKQHLPFSEVVNLKTTDGWRQLCNRIMKKQKKPQLADTYINKKALMADIAAKLADEEFVTYMLFKPCGIQSYKTVNGFEHTPMAGRNAVRAEQMRQALPVTKTEDLYELLGADITATDDEGKPIKPDTTPRFYYYRHEWYVSLCFPCKAEDMEAMTDGQFMATWNLAKRAPYTENTPM